MVKKSLVKEVFESIIVSTSKLPKSERTVATPIGFLPILTWLITLDERTRRIHLNAVTRVGLVSVSSSYPFSSVGAAYRFMVRL